MSGGLVALLDDIATLAKATASSIDDVASSAVKVSAKAVGVVIDDNKFPDAGVHFPMISGSITR